MNTPRPFDDPLDDIFGTAEAGEPVERVPLPPIPERLEKALYTTTCWKCGGSGQTRWGVCYACKGKGGKTTKTSPAKLAQAKIQREDRKEREIAEARETYKAELEWLTKAALRNSERGGTFMFPAAMQASFARWYSFTDRQLETIHRLMAKDAERAEAFQKAREARQQAAPVVDASPIAKAFQAAQDAARADGEGIKWLKLRLDTFRFTLAGPDSKNPGAIYVKEGETYLGKLVAGRFYRSRECTPEIEARILAAAANPAEAATAYGLRTGSCSCCGRELTNAESRARGIGPICAERFGF